MDHPPAMDNCIKKTIHPAVDNCIKQTIDNSLGIPTPSETLEAKLRASQDSECRLREGLLSLEPQLKRKDHLIACFKVSLFSLDFLLNLSLVIIFLFENLTMGVLGFLEQYEAIMNARALKKFVEENQRLAGECNGLVAQRCQLENECVLYDKDREALMEFGNDADERARKAQSQVLDLQRDLLLMQNELKKYKHHLKLVCHFFPPFVSLNVCISF